MTNPPFDFHIELCGLTAAREKPIPEDSSYSDLFLVHKYRTKAAATCV